MDSLLNLSGVKNSRKQSSRKATMQAKITSFSAKQYSKYANK
jgi:hypothetical protein